MGLATKNQGMFQYCLPLGNVKRGRNVTILSTTAVRFTIIVFIFWLAARHLSRRQYHGITTDLLADNHYANTRYTPPPPLPRYASGDPFAFTVSTTARKLYGSVTAISASTFHHERVSCSTQER